jgi:uncharacterized protein with HEPN domain
VNLDIVWNIVKVKIPVLASQVDGILRDENSA